MERQQWARIEELFEQAQARPAADRRQFLAGACAGDAPLQHELEAMLDVSGSEHALAVERLVVEDTRDHARNDPLIGVCLGPWRLVGVLGRGGMGLVYRGERADGSYRQDVAIKLVRAAVADVHAVDRFRMERQVLAHLVHPNIASLLDAGFAPDRTPYLVMELVDGVPITEWCIDQRLSLDARLRLFRVVCDTVQHAHRSLIVHRDLKPSNILVSRSGDVKLLDFGIAKLLDPAALDIGAPATRAEIRLLTPEYAALEQRQDAAVTTATDVYAPGVLLYELLTGVRPDTSAAAARRPRLHRLHRSQGRTGTPLRLRRAAQRGDRSVPRRPRRAGAARHARLPRPQVRGPQTTRGCGNRGAPLLPDRFRRCLGVAGAGRLLSRNAWRDSSVTRPSRSCECSWGCSRAPIHSCGPRAIGCRSANSSRAHRRALWRS